MSIELMPFAYGDHEIRVLRDDDGEPLVCANDLCEAIGLEAPRRAVARLRPDDVRQRHVIDSLGRSQLTTFLREPGVYDLLFRSDKPAAAPLRYLVCDEILPSIRKTGGYTRPEAEPIVPALDQGTVALIASVVAEAQKPFFELLSKERERVDTVVETAERIPGAAKWAVSVNHRLDALEAGPGDLERMTAKAYAKIRNLPPHNAFVKSLGQLSRSICLRDGHALEYVPDERWGEVGLWPIVALDEAAEQMQTMNV